MTVETEEPQAAIKNFARMLLNDIAMPPERENERIVLLVSLAILIDNGDPYGIELTDKIIEKYSREEAANALTVPWTPYATRILSQFDNTITTRSPSPTSVAGI